MNTMVVNRRLGNEIEMSVAQSAYVRTHTISNFFNMGDNLSDRYT